LGLLLQFASGAFLQDEPLMAELRPLLERHSERFAELPPTGQQALRALLDGEGPTLARRRREGVDARIRTAVGHAFGHREPGFFEHPSAVAYVQTFAHGLAISLEEFLHLPGEDLDEIADEMPWLALLLLIEPCQMPPKSLLISRDALRAIWDQIQHSSAESDDFWEGYMQNVELAFAVAFDKFKER
jgi:hypothetical protein